MKKTGKILSLIFALSFTQAAFAAIQASVDRSEVPQDESISLKISRTGGEGDLNPKFDAPDFEIMNQFESSKFSSVYINGKFENKSEQSITFILRPLKVGTLRIRNILNEGERAPDLSVQVIQENAYKKSVGNEPPALSGDAKNFFVKAEISKSRAYKGEQVIVSYYLYRRTRANLRDVMQYPSFQGFIREDLEMPILSGRPDFEAVSLGGIPFERALLARYALYPIKEGKLKIDGLAIRADYIPKNAGNDDLLQDPFFQFFSQVTPRTGTSKSDPITIDVLPLPEEGKSQNFTGGVGDFDVSSQIDSSNAKANSPVTLHVTVRGRGNTSLVEFPQVKWPKGIKFYESQGKSKNLGQGNTEKDFEVVLMPLEKGEYEIPPVEFEFFNPESRSYIKKHTAPIQLVVAEGEPGSSPQILSTTGNSQTNQSAAEVQAPQTFGQPRMTKKDGEYASAFLGQPWWKWVAWFGLIVFFSFIGLVVYDTAKKRSKLQFDLLRKKQIAEDFWSTRNEETEALIQQNAPTHQFSDVLELVVERLYEVIDESFGVTSRAMSQRDLSRILVETHRVSRESWSRIASFLEFSEMIRFSSSEGLAGNSELHQKIKSSISDARNICNEISSKRMEK